MNILMNNDEINKEIAFEIIRKYLDSIEKDELFKNVSKYSKECKKILISSLKGIEEVDDEEKIIDYYPSAWKTINSEWAFFIIGNWKKI